MLTQNVKFADAINQQTSHKTGHGIHGFHYYGLMKSIHLQFRGTIDLKDLRFFLKSSLVEVLVTRAMSNTFGSIDVPFIQLTTFGEIASHIIILSLK